MFTVYTCQMGKQPLFQVTTWLPDPHQSLCTLCLALPTSKGYRMSLGSKTLPLY